MGSPFRAMRIRGSATTAFRVASTSSIGSPGRTRQFTVARAVWGSALSAWPASRRVATHVVRRSALKNEDSDSRSAAAESGGSAEVARMSAASESGS